MYYFPVLPPLLWSTLSLNLLVHWGNTKWRYEEIQMRSRGNAKYRHIKQNIHQEIAQFRKEQDFLLLVEDFIVSEWLNLMIISICYYLYYWIKTQLLNNPGCSFISFNFLVSNFHHQNFNCFPDPKKVSARVISPNSYLMPFWKPNRGYVGSTRDIFVVMMELGDTIIKTIYKSWGRGWWEKRRWWRWWLGRWRCWWWCWGWWRYLWWWKGQRRWWRSVWISYSWWWWGQWQWRWCLFIFHILQQLEGFGHFFFFLFTFRHWTMGFFFSISPKFHNTMFAVLTA